MKIYATKQFSFRRWQSLLGGLLAIACSFPFLVIAFNYAWFNDLRLTDLVLWGVFALGIPLMMGSVGLWLVHAWLIRKIKFLEISDGGVKYGAEMFLWSEIQHIWASSDPGKWTTISLEKKGSRRVHDLSVTDAWTQEELSNLFETIKSEIASVHQELRVG